MSALLAASTVLAPPFVPAVLWGGRGVRPTCLAQGVNIEGNCNGDSRYDLADSIFLLSYLFRGGERPSCPARCDFWGDGRLDISDAIGFLSFTFTGGRAPQPLVLPREICANGKDEDCDGVPDDGCLYSVELAWDAVTTDLLGRPETVRAYRVHWGTDPTVYSSYLEVPVPGCTCVVVDAFSLGVKYYLAVSAVDLDGNESPLSQPVELLR